MLDRARRGLAGQRGLRARLRHRSGGGLRQRRRRDRHGRCGLSIEDSTGDPKAPLFELALAVERILAARRAIDGDGTGVARLAQLEAVVATDRASGDETPV